MGEVQETKSMDQLLKEKSIWERLPYRSDSGGVRPMMIEGRCRLQYERLLGMTDEERAWRKQWLKDQILAPDEPKEVPEIYKELYNPIRRFYLWPGNKLEKRLAPFMGKINAHKVRWGIGKSIQIITIGYFITYYFLFHGRDWTSEKGIRVYETRRAYYPGDPEYPKKPDLYLPQHFADYGFSKSPLYIDYSKQKKHHF